VLLNVGVCLLRLARLPEARVALGQAQRLLPAAEASVLDNMRALVEFEDYQRKYPTAQLGAAKSVAPGGEDADAASKPTLAARLTEEAIAMAEAGSLHNAFGLFEQAALADPADGKLWENLGKLRWLLLRPGVGAWPVSVLLRARVVCPQV
jgi:Flp pilus assembly protein TadD